MAAELFLSLDRKNFSKRKPGQENTGIYSKICVYMSGTGQRMSSICVIGHIFLF